MIPIFPLFDRNEARLIICSFLDDNECERAIKTVITQNFAFIEIFMKFTLLPVCHTVQIGVSANLFKVSSVLGVIYLTHDIIHKVSLTKLNIAVQHLVEEISRLTVAKLFFISGFR